MPIEHPETEFIGIDPAQMSPQESYRILLNCVSPRPIAFVSTVSPDGAPNLAPFSFFMAGGSNPPSVAFSPSIDRNLQQKHTLLNIRTTGEYVINVVTYEMRERMNQTSAEYPYGVSEWEQAGFEPAPAVKVRPARVADSPLAMECRLFQIISHGEGPTAANYVIGEVIYFHVAAYLMVNGQIDSTRVDYIGRMGGNWYSRANAAAMFEMARPQLPSK